MNALQLCRRQFSHKETLYQTFLKQSAILLDGNGPFAFLSLLYRGLGATYDVHFRLIGKRVGGFLLVLIELIWLGATAEVLRANIGWKSAISLQRGPVDPKFKAEGGAPTNHPSSQKTRLRSIVSYKNLDRSFFCFVTQSTRLTDGRTDRHLSRS